MRCMPISAAPHPAADKHTAGKRTAKWASAVVEEVEEGKRYRFVHLHESTVPPELARA